MFSPLPLVEQGSQQVTLPGGLFCPKRHTDRSTSISPMNTLQQGDIGHHFSLPQKETKGSTIQSHDQCPCQQVAGPGFDPWSPTSLLEPLPSGASFLYLLWAPEAQSSPWCSLEGKEGRVVLLRSCHRGDAPAAAPSETPRSAASAVSKSFGNLGPGPGAAERRMNSLRFLLSRTHRLVWGADEETDDVNTTWH